VREISVELADFVSGFHATTAWTAFFAVSIFVDAVSRSFFASPTAFPSAIRLKTGDPADRTERQCLELIQRAVARYGIDIGELAHA
jgi:hypothetical protein